MWDVAASFYNFSRYCNSDSLGLNKWQGYNLSSTVLKLELKQVPNEE